MKKALAEGKEPEEALEMWRVARMPRWKSLVEMARIEEKRILAGNPLTQYMRDLRIRWRGARGLQREVEAIDVAPSFEGLL